MVSRALPILALVCGCAAPNLDEVSANVTGTTIIALTFDDTFADNFQVGALTESHGMRATFYVNSGRIGAAGSLSHDQLVALEAAGHEIAGHTVSHANLATLDEAEMRRQVCTDRVALLDAGFRITSFAYPFSGQDATARQVVRECGYNSARLVGGLVNPNSCNGCPYAVPIPPTDPYQMRTNDSVKAETTLDALEFYVTSAEQHGGGFVPIVFHHVCDGCDSLAVSPATLDEFLSWLELRAASGTVVATVDAVIGGAVQPPVDAPPPDTIPPGSNLLRNSSLEVDDNADQIPDCWQRGGTGTNAATYTLTSGAFDGNVAQRIDMTSWTSGVRRIVSRQDLGGCAPVATPGHIYRVSAVYKSTAPVMFTVYYRNAAGGWVWFAQSPSLPATATFAAANYTMPAFPSSATAISVGLSLVNLGTVTMDAFELVDTAAPPADSMPPTLAISCNGVPCATTWYRTAVSVSLAASDNVGVTEVRYTLDGSDPAIAGTLYAAPFNVSASATVRATAVDAATNRTSQSAPLLVDIVAPTARVSAPATNATVSGITPIVADTTDNVAVYRVRFYRDGVQLGTRVQTTYRWNWDTNTATIGLHTLSVQAEDAAGNATRSAEITVNVVR